MFKLSLRFHAFVAFRGVRIQALSLIPYCCYRWLALTLLLYWIIALFKAFILFWFWWDWGSGNLALMLSWITNFIYKFHFVLLLVGFGLWYHNELPLHVKVSFCFSFQLGLWLGYLHIGLPFHLNISFFFRYVGFKPMAPVPYWITILITGCLN